MIEATALAPKALFLEDVRVGQRFSSKSHTVDEAQIKEFAAAFDPQPFHLDDEAAKSTLFDGLAASGWHTAAITMKLLVESGLPLAGGILGRGGEINWPKPTRSSSAPARRPKCSKTRRTRLALCRRAR